MGKKVRLAQRYLSYRLKAKGSHEIHSPFVFDLFRQVINSQAPFPIFSEIEHCRRILSHDHRVIEVTDYGAGSLSHSESLRMISTIARHASKPRKYGELLFRLVRYFNSVQILEMGTSLGLSAAYLAGANPAIKLVTLEGCPQTGTIARKNLEILQLHNISVMVGRFEDLLPKALACFSQLDLVFFDGNHREKPTLAYFKACLPYSTDYSLFIFDDIHWTAEMEAAWAIIQQHPQVTMTIDLFFLGLVFFRKEFQEKQHFILKY